VTGRDVTPHLLTHLASPDAQVIHLHSLTLSCSCLSSLAYLYIPTCSGSSSLYVKSCAITCMSKGDARPGSLVE
jgi:hypothetical protein